MTEDVVLHINQLAKKYTSHLETNDRKKSPFPNDDTLAIQEYSSIDQHNMSVSLGNRPNVHTAEVNEKDTAELSPDAAAAPTSIDNNNNYYQVLVNQNEEDRSNQLEEYGTATADKEQK